MSLLRVLIVAALVAFCYTFDFRSEVGEVYAIDAKVDGNAANPRVLKEVGISLEKEVVSDSDGITTIRYWLGQRESGKQQFTFLKLWYLFY